MINLSQFVGNVPIGRTISLPYVGSIYNAADGTQWICNDSLSPFAYTSDYSNLPDYLTSPHPIFPGPETNGTWANDLGLNGNLSLAYNPAGPLYVTSTYGYDGTSYYYYTSSNGSTWTKRTFPNNKNYQMIQYTAGLFIAISSNSTTNAIITSTDGINWSSFTGISTSWGDAVSNGSTNIVLWPLSAGTSTSYSTDGGATWSTATITSNGVASTPQNGLGYITWNAGAGLFIGSSATSGAYQTSPTGATWTLRNAQGTFFGRANYFPSGTKFISNATTTVALGNYGYFATTTDGLTWSNHGNINSTEVVTGTPGHAWYDGTRFCARYVNFIYYSTDGISWTKAKTPGLGSAYGTTSSGVAFFTTTAAYTGSVKILKVSDVTSTTRQTVCVNMPSAQGSLTGSVNIITYFRIK